MVPVRITAADIYDLEGEVVEPKRWLMPRGIREASPLQPSCSTQSVPAGLRAQHDGILCRPDGQGLGADERHQQPLIVALQFAVLALPPWW